MRYTLLLADDSVTIQRVIELTFAEEDVQVITVGDGQSAIDRLESNPPDIVLADVDMPRRDGYEVAAYVKSRPKLAHIPVVLLTGAFEPIDQARATASGSSDVLAKPFEPQMVINRVKQLLGKKRQEDLEVPSPESFQPPQQPQQGMNAPPSPRPPARSSMAMNDEHATEQNQPAREVPGQPAQQPVSLDDYFDQLDAAFSNLHQPTSTAAGQLATIQAEEDWIDSQEVDLNMLEQDPIGTPQPLVPTPATTAAAPAPPPAPVAMAPVPAPAATAPAPVAAVAALAAVAPVAAPAPFAETPAPPVAAPAPVPPAPPAYVAPAPEPAPVAAAPPPPPAPAPVPPPRITANPFAELSAAKAEAAARTPAPVITDEVIEEVVARVLLRLSDRIVRETVTAIVSKTAERLVQEEILRIKTEGQ